MFSHHADLIDFLANTFLLLFFSSSAPLLPCLLCRFDTPSLILPTAASSLTRFKSEIPSPCLRPPPLSPQPPAHQVWIKTLPPSEFDYAGPLLFHLIHNVQQMAAKAFGYVGTYLYVYHAAGPSCLLAPSSSPPPSPCLGCQDRVPVIFWGRLFLKCVIRLLRLHCAAPSPRLYHNSPTAACARALELPGFPSHAAECTIVSVIREATSRSACCLRVSRFLFTTFDKFACSFCFPQRPQQIKLEQLRVAFHPYGAPTYPSLPKRTLCVSGTLMTTHYLCHLESLPPQLSLRLKAGFPPVVVLDFSFFFFFLRVTEEL